MIDLIIPVYNNYQGLLHTLMSINLKVFEITVVDDCSNQPIKTTFPINYIRLKQNSGPGQARQVGINNTSNEYIAFIDAGDIFLSQEIQEQMNEKMKSHPEPNILMWSYFHGKERTNEYDNRMHGKIYKRSFLDRYGITFCSESSYVNEDIGFNRACRICTEADNIGINYIDIPVIQQILDANSLTKRNNQEFLYKKQNRGLALNSIHTINIGKKNNINMKEEINMIATSLYYWFLVTAVDRPDCLQDQWSGAKIFYDYFKDEIKATLLISGNAYMKKCLEFRNRLHFPINILRFADEIQKYEILPKKYLT